LEIQETKLEDAKEALNLDQKEKAVELVREVQEETSG